MTKKKAINERFVHHFKTGTSEVLKSDEKGVIIKNVRTKEIDYILNKEMFLIESIEVVNR